MEKTIKINISGSIFQIEEEAYEILRDYLQAINIRLKNVAGGNEMIEDIESRIAEIFQQSPSWKTGVISKDDVQEMINTMGSPDEIAGDPDSEFRYERNTGSRRLYRNTNGSIIGGVCNGIGDYLKIDTVWVRIIFVIFSIVYLFGLLLYAILWIALPKAPITLQNRDWSNEKHGADDIGKKIKSEVTSAAEGVKSSASQGAARVGSAFNEVFMAFGKFFIILFRIVLAFLGVSFIVIGFSLLFSFLIIAFFNSSVFMGNVFDTEIFYLPDFLSFIVDPALTPWLMILSSLVIILPLLGVIYWGIRMVFQFRAKDLVVNLIMFIIWIVSCTALALLLFSEGMSFSNSGRTTEDIYIENNNTLYIAIENDLSAIEYDRSMVLPFEDFTLYLNEYDHKIYASPEVSVYTTEDEPKIQIVKYSNGRSRSDAREKADNLVFNYSIEGDTLNLDEFFAIPKGNMWSGANIKIRLYLPEGYRLYVEEEAEDLFNDYLGNGLYSYELGDNYWEMTDEGLKKD